MHHSIIQCKSIPTIKDCLLCQSIQYKGHIEYLDGWYIPSINSLLSYCWLSIIPLTRLAWQLFPQYLHFWTHRLIIFDQDTYIHSHNKLLLVEYHMMFFLWSFAYRQLRWIYTYSDLCDSEFEWECSHSVNYWQQKKLIIRTILICFC